MYSFVSLAGRLRWSLLLLAVVFVTIDAQSSSSSFASSSTAEETAGPKNDYPCQDNSGNIYQHGESFKMTVCSRCDCGNGTLNCEFESCQPPTCREPIKFPDECCRLCPYNVTVTDVTPKAQGSAAIEEGSADNELVVNLDVMYANNRETTSISGQGLWTTSMWMSPDEDGSTKLSGTVVDEALTQGQQSKELKKTGGSERFVINDIRYQFDLTDHTCADAKYLCAKFNKGANPQTDKDFLSFTFESRPDDEVLTGCTEMLNCKGVTIRGLRAEGRTQNLVVGRKSDVTIDATATFTDSSRPVSGSGLWRMGIFGSKNAKGSGEKFDYQSQTLSNSHQARPLVLGGPRELTFTGAKAEFDWLAVGCNGFDYLCYDFSKGPDATPDYTFSSLPDGDTMTLCGPHACQAGTDITSTSARLNSGKVADGRVSNPYSIAYSATGAGTGIDGDGLWSLSAYGSPNADGSGKMLGEQTQVFTAQQQGQDFLPAQSTRLDYGNVDFDFDMTGLTCEDVKYLCVKLRKGDNPSPDFTLTPKPDESVMRSCVPAECSGVMATDFSWEYDPGTPIPGTPTPVPFSAQMRSTADSRAMAGTGLWRMGMYGSKSPQGDPNDRFGYVSQALNAEGAATTLVPGAAMNVRDQSVDFDIGSVGCNEYGYVCAEFTKGDMPEPDFRFEVQGRADTTSNVLTSCKKQKCLARAVFTGLESSFAGDGPVIEEKQDNALVMDINGVTGQGSTLVSGSNLWRVGMFGSANGDGRGRKLAYQTQVLSQPQSDQTLETDQDLPFPGTQVSFDMTGLQCQDVKYICTELRKNPDAAPDYTFVAEPNERSLVSCTELGDRCKGVTVTDMDWSYTPGAMQYGMPTPLSIDATVQTTPESRQLEGSGLWKMNIFGSRSADGAGERRPQRTQILDGFNQARPLPAGGPVEFSDVATRLPMEDLGCGEFGYLCLEFAQGDYANPKYSFRTAGEGDSIINCKPADCGGVYVSGVDSNLVGGDLYEGKPSNSIQFDTTVQTTDQSAPMVGRNMWRLNMYGSERSNGQGPRLNPQEQVLSDYFSSRELMTPGQTLDFQTVNADYDMTGVNCKKLKYLCTEFSRNPSSSREFELTPVPNERVLRDCMEVPDDMCKGVVIDDMDWSMDVLSDKVVSGQPSAVRLNVDVDPRATAGSASGDTLWRVGMYGATRPDGKGKQIGMRRQILTREQSGRDLTAGNTLSFGEIDTEFDLSAVGCESEFQYLCLEYAKGLRAQPDFKFQTSDGGEVVTRCKEQDCRKGVKVRGLDVVSNDYSVLKENDPYNRVMFDLTAATTPDTGGVYGSNLWDLKLFGSNNENGYGRRFNEQPGAFSKYQRDKDAYPGEDIDFGMVDANFNMRGLTCNDVRYLCAELTQSSRPDPPFEFVPVPDETVLTKCFRQKCDGITIDNTDLRGDDFDISDSTEEIEFEVTVTSNPNSGDATGRNLWRLETFLSNNADGTARSRTLDRQTLTPQMASRDIRSGSRVTFNNLAARVSKEDVPCAEGGGYICTELSRGDRPSIDFTLAGAREGSLRKCRKLNCVKEVKPESGPPGDQGPPGEPGLGPDFGSIELTGPAGAQGPPGNQGRPGNPGRMGPAGYKGPRGDNGPYGRPGVPGPPGPPGPPGEAAAPTYNQGYQSMKGPGYAGYTPQRVVQGAQGASGAPGAAGHRGPMGLQGPAGETGPSGVTGPAGPPGPRGSQGDDGRDGSHGNRGAMGTAGAMGRQGSGGRPGRPGAQGHKGWRGARGRKGGLGDSGAAGESGNRGATGPAGAVGARGERGQSGERGERGSRGVAGVRGQDGSDGDVGNMGPQGATGPMGAMGLTGGKGEAGEQGDQGIQGIQGAAGESGSDGATGATGAVGAAGKDGETGAVGDVGGAGAPGPGGAAGARGSSGARGGTGVAGEVGAHGYPGLAGSRGSDGARGVRGPAGIRGEAGADGSDGSDGPDGAAGAPGARGPTGVRGAIGGVGPSGAMGSAGLRGDSGPQGARGAPGERGDAGAQGRVGDAGAPGARGAPGPDGREGNDGKPGPAGPGGNDGRPGSSGAVGLQGQQGNTGPGGAKGVGGEEGRTGPSGAAGLRGQRGSSGSDGPDGPAGAAGAQGARGESGPQGAAGPGGPSGGVGAPGLRGAKGKRGTPGVAGVAGQGGVQGMSGDRGGPGPMGLAGASGESGPSGPDGRDGRNGEPGNKGFNGDVGRIGIPGLPGAPGDRGGVGGIGNSGAPGARGATGKRGESGDPGQRGNPGPAGPVGSPGLSGEPGDIGRSGSTGPDGPRGNQGEKGRPGPRGASGLPGRKGAVGAQGSRGAKGPQGVPGDAGVQGSTGSPGQVGAPGATGAKGSRGEVGEQGAVGPGGNSGAMGMPGSSGAPGARGEVGPAGGSGRQGAPGRRGESGSQGQRGIRGIPGPQGISGARGENGRAGSAGPAGAAGAAGVSGILGELGTMGMRGAPGPTGPAGRPGADGSTGKRGSSGDDGAPGRVGPQGAKGSRGPTGSDGRDGSDGATGDQGQTGSTGDRGAQGAQGPSGPAGMPGMRGPAGSQGERGSRGPAGPAGPRGSTGADGNLGPAGPSGPAGARGETGATGVQGHKGWGGSQGAPGIQGTKGTAGTRGETGRPGPSGPPGTDGSRGRNGNNGQQGPRGMSGRAGQRGTDGGSGPAGPPGPPGPAGAPGALSYSGGGYAYTGSSDSGKGANPYAYYGDDAEVEEDDFEARIRQLRLRIMKLMLPNGESEYPARSCKDLFKCYPELPSGYYTLDPSEGSPYDKFVAYCDRKTNGTCISPDNKLIPKGTYYLGDNEEPIDFSDMKNGSMISYSVKPVQLTLLRLIYSKATQNMTYHCRNSFAFRDDRMKTNQALTLVGPNDVRMNPNSLKRELKYDVEEDGCRAHDGTWRQTTVSYTTKKTERLPLVDFALSDIGKSNQQFGVDVGPVCFY